MNNQLRINPAVVCRNGRDERLRDRLVPALLRTFAATSRTLFGGRAIGLASTVAARALGHDGVVDFRLANGSVFSAKVTDRYWLNYFLVERQYETDIDHFLSNFLEPKDSFLDCGANLGLWSIAAARIISDPPRVVAVEAGTRTFAQLEHNCSQNGRSFSTRHQAISPRSGEQLTFFSSTTDHASATLVESLSPKDASIETVTTVSLLDLLNEQRSKQTSFNALTFVKLDIEGMEREIFSTLSPQDHSDIIVIYEDHGSEEDHVTAKVLELGFKAVFLGDDGHFEPITKETLSRLDQLKVEPARGYNLLAVAPEGAAANRLREILA